MGRIFPNRPCRSVARIFAQAKTTLSYAAGWQKRWAVFPHGKVALARRRKGSYRDCRALIAVLAAALLCLEAPRLHAADSSSTKRKTKRSSGRIGAPGEPMLRVQPVDRSSLQPLKTRHKKKRKYLRRKAPTGKSYPSPAEQAAAVHKAKQAAKKAADAKATVAPQLLRWRWSLGLTYNQVTTSGSQHRDSTVEPSVNLELSYALTPMDSQKPGGTLWLGFQFANFNGATIYNDLFFRYSYSYFGPSISYRWHGVRSVSGSPLAQAAKLSKAKDRRGRLPAATAQQRDPKGQPKPEQRGQGPKTTALSWSVGVKAALLALAPIQEGQSNAEPEELEFGGSRAVRLANPGLLAELGASYHLHNFLAVDFAAGTVLATEKTYTYALFGVSGFM